MNNQSIRLNSQAIHVINEIKKNLNYIKIKNIKKREILNKFDFNFVNNLKNESFENLNFYHFDVTPIYRRIIKFNNFNIFTNGKNFLFSKLPNHSAEWQGIYENRDLIKSNFYTHFKTLEKIIEYLYINHNTKFLHFLSC